MTLDQLLQHLHHLRKSHGGAAEVFIADRKAPAMAWIVARFTAVTRVDAGGENDGSTIVIHPARR
jgi:hypothetical protein